MDFDKQPINKYPKGDSKMKYLKIPIVDIDDGINSEMMIASDAILHNWEPMNMTLDHLLGKVNSTPSFPSIKEIVNNKAYTVSTQTSFEVPLSSKDSFVFVKIDYAIDVTNGKPIQVYHSINHDMGKEKKATIFLKTDKTALCSVSVYELSREQM